MGRSRRCGRHVYFDDYLSQFRLRTSNKLPTASRYCLDSTRSTPWNARLPSCCCEIWLPDGGWPRVSGGTSTCAGFQRRRKSTRGNRVHASSISHPQPGATRHRGGGYVDGRRGGWRAPGAVGWGVQNHHTSGGWRHRRRCGVAVLSCLALRVQRATGGRRRAHRRPPAACSNHAHCRRILPIRTCTFSRTQCLCQCGSCDSSQRYGARLCRTPNATANVFDRC